MTRYGLVASAVSGNLSPEEKKYVLQDAEKALETEALGLLGTSATETKTRFPHTHP